MDLSEIKPTNRNLLDSPAPPRTLQRLLTALGLLVVLAEVIDLSQFARTCAHYRARAALGLGQLTPEVRPAEAIVVLTGDQGRIPRALELLRARGSALLIISGVAKGISLKDLVNQQGDSTLNIHEIWKKIRLESESSSTIGNAEHSAELLAVNRARRVILVTSDYHMDRSLEVFRKVLPQIEILDYSVPSSLIKGKHLLDGFWKIATEYWKNRLFRFFYASQVEPYRPGTAKQFPQ